MFPMNICNFRANVKSGKKASFIGNSIYLLYGAEFHLFYMRLPAHAACLRNLDDEQYMRTTPRRNDDVTITDKVINDTYIINKLTIVCFCHFVCAHICILLLHIVFISHINGHFEFVEQTKIIIFNPEVCMNRLSCMRLAKVQYYIKGRYEQRARCGRTKILL